MHLPSEAELLRIFIGESDKQGHRPLFEVIVEEARRQGMAGATVLRGVIGFGKASRIHTAKILRLSEDLPIVIEIVDKPERIEAFLPDLDAMIGDGLVTLEKVRVIAYRHNQGAGTERKPQPRTAGRDPGRTAGPPIHPGAGARTAMSGCGGRGPSRVPAFEVRPEQA